MTSLFVACARKLNYGETDFRASVGSQWEGRQDGREAGRELWLPRRVLVSVLQFVGLADLVTFLVFFLGWVFITLTFVTMITQG